MPFLSKLFVHKGIIEICIFMNLSLLSWLCVVMESSTLTNLLDLEQDVNLEESFDSAMTRRRLESRPMRQCYGKQHLLTNHVSHRTMAHAAEPGPEVPNHAKYGNFLPLYQ